MLDHRLNKQELAEFRAAHRRALNMREAYRIIGVILLGNGRTVAAVADTLLFDPDTVRAYFKRYKKPKLSPEKADATAQEAFLEEYENLKQNSDEDDVVLFMHATHPQHNPVISYGWIKGGKEHPVKSNTGRRCLNINGVIDV